MIVEIVVATLCWVFVFFLVCVTFIVLVHTYCLFATTRYYDEDYTLVTTGAGESAAVNSIFVERDDYRNILTLFDLFRERVAKRLPTNDDVAQLSLSIQPRLKTKLVGIYIVKGTVNETDEISQRLQIYSQKVDI